MRHAGKGFLAVLLAAAAVQAATSEAWRLRFEAERGFAESETLTFLLQYEEGRWRVDLFRLLALSGVSLEPPAVFWLVPGGR